MFKGPKQVPELHKQIDLIVHKTMKIRNVYLGLRDGNKNSEFNEKFNGKF